MIPFQGEREPIIMRSHANGHFYCNRTKELILQEGVWWPGLLQSVKGVVNTCKVCSIGNAKCIRNLQHGAWPTTRFPFTRVRIDTGIMKVSLGRNRILILAVDSLSKWLEAAFVQSMASEQAARFFQRCILSILSTIQ